jgi:hypothetical protein
LSRHDNQITRQENTACVIVAPRQSSSRRDRQNGLPDCRCFPIQIVALHYRDLNATVSSASFSRTLKMTTHIALSRRAPPQAGSLLHRRPSTPCRKRSHRSLDLDPRRAGLTAPRAAPCSSTAGSPHQRSSRNSFSEWAKDDRQATSWRGDSFRFTARQDKLDRNLTNQPSSRRVSS